MLSCTFLVSFKIFLNCLPPLRKRASSLARLVAITVRADGIFTHYCLFPNIFSAILIAATDALPGGWSPKKFRLRGIGWVLTGIRVTSDPNQIKDVRSSFFFFLCTLLRGNAINCIIIDFPVGPSFTDKRYVHEIRSYIKFEIKTSTIQTNTAMTSPRL